MPTTDTFIIPPVEGTPSQTTDGKKAKKKSEKGKWAILVSLIILIITLPIGIYYISQQQQVADTRSKAASNGSCVNITTSGTCGNIRCSGKTEGQCDASDSCCIWKAPNVVITPIPVVKVVDTGGTGGGAGGAGGGTTTSTTRTAQGTYHGCGYLNNTGDSGPAASTCETANCGGQSCGSFTFKCGIYCLSASCGSTACYDDVVATATPTTGPTSTPAPTSSSSLGQCDASCESDSNCESGLRCSSIDGVNRCRKEACPATSSCSCPAAAATEAPIGGQEMPVSGVGPGIIGSITVVGSILLVVAGLVL